MTMMLRPLCLLLLTAGALAVSGGPAPFDWTDAAHQR